MSLLNQFLLVFLGAYYLTVAEWALIQLYIRRRKARLYREWLGDFHG